MTAAPDADFGGHPRGEWASLDAVPDGVALAFDLANSRDERAFHRHGGRQGPRDLLASPGDLAAWFRYRRVVIDTVTREDLELAHRVRAVVRLFAEANTDPRARQRARAALADVVDELPLRLAMDASGAMQVEAVGTGSRPILAGLLAGAVDPSTREAWSRLKMCAAEDCRWVFYDRSKPRTGRWCSMAVCGNRLKTRDYRRRRASRTRPSR